MRRVLAAFLVFFACPVERVRAAEPVDAPVVQPTTPSQHPVPDIDLPGWLAKVAGFAQPPQPEPSQPQGRLRFSLLPFVVTNPLIGLGAGVAAAGAFRLGKESSTSYSSFVVSGLITSQSQRSLNLRSEVRLPDNDWLFVGDWALSHFPGPAFGLGGETPDSAESIVDRREVKMHETAYRRLKGPFYLGLGYDLDDEYNIEDLSAEQGVVTAFSQYPVGTKGRSVSSGLTESFLIEGRDNPANPWRGYYALARLRLEPGLTDQSWESLWVEGRGYFPLPNHEQTVAVWGYAWSAWGQVPWFMLPAIGRDPEQRSGRGYIEARHVGRDLLGAEGEWRFVLWQFVGGVVGANVHSVSDRKNDSEVPSFHSWHPAVFTGVRLVLDRRSLTAVAVDLAVQPDGVAAYLNFNEAF